MLTPSHKSSTLSSQSARGLEERKKERGSGSGSRRRFLALGEDVACAAERWRRTGCGSRGRPGSAAAPATRCSAAAEGEGGEWM